MEDNRKVLICQLVADFVEGPPAESFCDTCEKCGRAVWHAYTSPKVDIVLCADCAEAEIKAHPGEHKFEPPTKEQLEEFLAYYGLPKKTIKWLKGRAK